MSENRESLGLERRRDLINIQWDAEKKKSVGELERQ